MDKSIRSLKGQASVGLATLAIALWLAMFLPAGSLDYWQGWTYWLLFMGCVSAISFYFMKKDTRLIDSRLKAGPVAEKEKEQKLI